jgi:hypothetical protein
MAGLGTHNVSFGENADPKFALQIIAPQKRLVDPAAGPARPERNNRGHCIAEALTHSNKSLFIIN